MLDLSVLVLLGSGFWVFLVLGLLWLDFYLVVGGAMCQLLFCVGVLLVVMGWVGGWILLHFLVFFGGFGFAAGLVWMTWYNVLLLYLLVFGLV